MILFTCYKLRRVCSTNTNACVAVYAFICGAIIRSKQLLHHIRPYTCSCGVSNTCTLVYPRSLLFKFLLGFRVNVVGDRVFWVWSGWRSDVFGGGGGVKGVHLNHRLSFRNHSSVVVHTAQVFCFLKTSKTFPRVNLRTVTRASIAWNQHPIHRCHNNTNNWVWLHTLLSIQSLQLCTKSIEI